MNILQINLIIHLQSRGLNYSGQQFGREKKVCVTMRYSQYQVSQCIVLTQKSGRHDKFHKTQISKDQMLRNTQ